MAEHCLPSPPAFCSRSRLRRDAGSRKWNTANAGRTPTDGPRGCVRGRGGWVRGSLPSARGALEGITSPSAPTPPQKRRVVAVDGRPARARRPTTERPHSDANPPQRVAAPAGRSPTPSAPSDGGRRQPGSLVWARHAPTTTHPPFASQWPRNAATPDLEALPLGGCWVAQAYALVARAARAPRQLFFLLFAVVACLLLGCVWLAPHRARRVTPIVSSRHSPPPAPLTTRPSRRGMSPPHPTTPPPPSRAAHPPLLTPPRPTVPKGRHPCSPPATFRPFVFPHPTIAPPRQTALRGPPRRRLSGW